MTILKTRMAELRFFVLLISVLRSANHPQVAGSHQAGLAVAAAVNVSITLRDFTKNVNNFYIA